MISIFFYCWSRIILKLFLNATGVSWPENKRYIFKYFLISYFIVDHNMREQNRKYCEYIKFPILDEA